MTRQDGQRIAAAVRGMSGIKAEPEQIGRRPAHQRVDLVRRLDVGGAVMVENGREAGGASHGARDSFGAGRKRRPTVRVKRVRGRDAPRPRRARRHCRRRIGQHERRLRGAGASEQPRGFQRRGFTGIVCARIAERHGDERADQGEVASIDLGAHGRGIGAEESPVAELGAGVPGGGDLIEHLRRRRRQRRRLELEHAPRARRVGDADHRNDRCRCRAASYVARALTTSSMSETSATGTSHHDS